MKKDYLSGFYGVFFICCMLCATNKIFAQAGNTHGVKIFHFSSSYTCFPETSRLNGYTYSGEFFDPATHYSDSTVLVVVPDHLKVKNNRVELVFWFHGWRNSIDSALNYFHLASQLADSKTNAVLVLVEGAKNAADSYGGKLEQPGVFSRLVEDVIMNLQKNKIVVATCNAGNIVLAGHSGAYRVMAFMLQNGGIEVKEVLLFDALYSQADKYIDWIKKDSTNRFVNLYTDGGGTADESVKMTWELKVQNLPSLFTEEKEMNASLLRSERIVFIHTGRKHNDIIFEPDNFRFFLENSPFLKKTR